MYLFVGCLNTSVNLLTQYNKCFKNNNGLPIRQYTLYVNIYNTRLECQQCDIKRGVADIDALSFFKIHYMVNGSL